MKKVIVIFFFLMASVSLSQAQTTDESESVLRDTYKRWTFQTIFNPFKSMRCEIRCTSLSPELLQVWRGAVTDQNITARIDALINAMQQDKILVYLLEIDPGKSGLYTIDMKKIKKRTKLFIMDKNSKGYKPKQVTSNLERKLESSQRYYGVMAFQVKAEEILLQNLSMETYFESWDFLESKQVRDKNAYIAQFNFHANGAPENDQPENVPATAEITGRLKGAFPLVSMITKKTL
ncbi:hypothetical protein JXQ31_02430 [candidate division KSB1 bacterium]|nr:hypothetical protein [candidate division KSB1 bacterium]